MTDPYEERLPEVTDDELFGALKGTHPYTIVILKRGARYEPRESRSAEVAGTVLQHGKRNYALRKAGLMAIVCPVGDGSEVTGVSIFSCDADETRRIMEGDPGVQAGVFAYEIHPTESFPGDRLP